jgi:hypothetical protein
MSVSLTLRPSSEKAGVVYVDGFVCEIINHAARAILPAEH